jgi:hypothetical protein
MHRIMVMLNGGNTLWNRILSFRHFNYGQINLEGWMASQSTAPKAIVGSLHLVMIVEQKLTIPTRSMRAEASKPF